MPNTRQTRRNDKADIYPAPDAWRILRRQIGADTDGLLADAIGVSRPTIARAHLEVGDTAVGYDLVAQACDAFRDMFASPFDFLFRVRRSHA